MIDDTVRLVCLYMLLLREIPKLDTEYDENLAQLSTFMYILKENKIVLLQHKN